ncbi:LysR substrate-binding domain-containing protein [Streptomyces sp. NPDC088768]|uniref:LysR substrate-binding domain-containing protein n=1 Tax=Streptomyces sp. NPDC088768 TaxID=3365894 RepID=UPI0037F3E64B
MELRHLRYFLAVADEGGFTRAAARLHVSQPGISAQIAQLERELGAVLFDRSARAVRLTEAGEVVRRHARQVLAAERGLRAAVDELNALVRGSLVVGMIMACTVEPFFAALAAFHRAHPGVALRLVEDDSDRLAARVREGTIDLALIGAAHRAPADLAAREVVNEPLAVAVPPGHPLAARDSVTLDALLAHPLLCLPHGTGIRASLDAACAEHGLVPAVTMEANAPGAVLHLAARGLGAAVLSASMVEGVPGLRALRLDGTAVRGVLALVTRHAPAAPALAALLAHCDDAFGTGPGTPGGPSRARRAPGAHASA